MFRYLGLAWDNTRPTSALGAGHLALRAQARPDWDTALRRPGLAVFTTGSRPGVNSALALPGDRGTVLGRLFRRNDLHTTGACAGLLTHSEARHILDSDGVSLVNDFWGRYVAFLPAPGGGTCVLRDPSGTLPCFLIRHEGVSIVFSWLEDALDLLSPRALPRVHGPSLETLLLQGAPGGRETGLEGVEQILPGEIRQLGDELGASLLWNALQIARSPTQHSVAEAATLLRDTVRACTRAWASCYDRLLLRLSGGIDSSILLACLTPGLTPTDVLCVNYHSPGSDSDERPYARLAAQRAGRDLIERQRDPDFQLEQVLHIARMPAPVPYLGWMNAKSDARLAAAHGASAMFTGAGGDPLFFEFHRWWPAADYLSQRGLDRGFANAAMDAARLGKVSVWRVLAHALAEAVWPNPRARALMKPPDFLSQDLRHHHATHEGFLQRAGHRATALPIGKHMQALALTHPIGYYDPFEQAAAPEGVSPLLSQPLVELSLRLPSYLLTHGGHGRALARRAFAADLPPQIATRRSKGGMEEHITQVLLAHLDTARSLLLDGELVRRGLLDRARLELLLSGRPTTLVGPVSQIHALIAIEAWLSRWPR